MPFGAVNLKRDHDTDFSKNSTLLRAVSIAFAVKEVDLKPLIRNILILRNTEQGESIPKFNPLNSFLNDLTIHSAGAYKRVILTDDMTVKKNSSSYQTDENEQLITLTKLQIENTT